MLAGLGAKPEFLETQRAHNRQELSTPKKLANIIQRSELTNTGCKQLYDMYQTSGHNP